jgi:hypothetical protein
MNVIHLAEPARANRPWCGAKTAHPQVTADHAVVTCQRCLSFMSRFSDHSPVPAAGAPSCAGQLGGYRAFHAIGCPARTGWLVDDCTCGGLDQAVWNPGDEPAARRD